MSVQIVAKSVNGKVIPGFVGNFSYDKFDPDAIVVEFTGGNVWMMDREMLEKGGDIGGDVAITVNNYITTILLRRETIKAKIAFNTQDIRDFLRSITAKISIPVMREAMVDNLIVEIFSDLV